MKHSSARGSVLVATLIVAILIAILTSSYMSLVLNDYKLSLRSLKANCALNLAEAGIDSAMHDLKSGLVPGSAWTTVHDSSGNVLYYSRTLVSGRDLAGGDFGSCSVLVEKYSTTGGSTQTPIITSQGTIAHAGFPNLVKQVRVKLRSANNNPCKGVISKQTISMSGTNVVFDAYDSALGAYNAAVPVGSTAAIGKVGATNITDGITVAVTQSTSNLDINKNTVYGHVAFAGNSASVNYTDRVVVSNGGSLTASTTATGVSYDTSLITPNNEIILPDPPTTPVNSSSTAGTLYSAPGANSSTTLGHSAASATNPSYYYLSGDLKLSGQTTITVVGPTVLVIDGSLSTTGNNAGIIIDNASNASLTIYVKGDIGVEGQGIVNSSPSADKVYLIPTGAPGQNIDVGGNGGFTGVIYAPKYDVKLHGNGGLYGAIVANSITAVGNGGFHYDEQCGKRFATSAGYTITQWQELTNEGPGNARDARSPLSVN